MADYIDRAKLGIGECNREIFENKSYADGWNAAIKILQEAPAADVAEVRHGEWQITEYDYYDCSVCGNSYYNGCESSAEARQRLEERPYDVYKYCPNCGAKMDGDSGG